MNNQTYLQSHAEAAVLNIDIESMKTLIELYAQKSNWSSETLRVRWDGMSALIDWIKTLPDLQKPPLHNLNQKDTRVFINYLEARNLTKSTIKGYKRGADVLTKVLRAASVGGLDLDCNYQPFSGLSIKPKQLSPLGIDDTILKDIYPMKTRAKLKVLVALHNLGMSTSEIASCRWKDIDLQARTIRNYNGKVYPISLSFQAAYTELEGLIPTPINEDSKLLSWKPSTVRQWKHFIRNKATEIKQSA